MRRRRPWWGLLLPWVVAALLLAVVPRGSPSIPKLAAPETGFGGYTWSDAAVSSVSAQWTVPAIILGSPAGSASTWVGAQNVAGGYPFVQLGTIEETDGVNFPLYFAFWSDTAVSFHAQEMLSVSSGDKVVATMTEGSNGWSLGFADLTNGSHVTRHIAYGPGAYYSEAEWIQEDPSPDEKIAAQDVPYPDMSGVSFTHLLVNDQAPRLGLADGQTMMTSDGRWWAPSPVRDDSFHVAEPTGYAHEYLHDSTPAVRALSGFYAALNTWPSLRQPARSAIVEALSSAYSKFTAGLRSEHWPSALHGTIVAVTDQNSAIESDLREWGRDHYSEGNHDFTALLNDMDGTEDTAARAALGLPPV
ncbi:MAG TPA: G1 family glutamic endopeptidase [Acidimicrobiales bacterium]|nr:G1 family glutamic endopeptidase [Acidimicrobiales bacterium]